MSEKKETQKQSDIVYALSDYKQLVLQYKTKYSELMKAYVFWKTSSFWLVCLAAVAVLFSLLSLSDSRRQSTDQARNIQLLNRRVQSLSDQAQACGRQFQAAREELAQKQGLIAQLEKNISTVSKKQVERLLEEKGEK